MEEENREAFEFGILVGRTIGARCTKGLVNWFFRCWNRRRWVCCFHGENREREGRNWI
uniref:Uncharacterized protein n=1 Tax=Manihot esculenta TaxID=3983 RepID=A0A2C9UPW7_MANES